MNKYQIVKKALEEQFNVYDVYRKGGYLVVVPRQDKQYMRVVDVFDFDTTHDWIISKEVYIYKDVKFYIHHYNHSNTQIYELYIRVL